METKNIAALVFIIAALLCHLRTGDAQRSCGKSDITIAVRKTGKVVGRQPEYEATIGTSCSCPMKDVRVWCGGLEDSAVPLDGGKVEVDEGMCVLKQPVVRGSPLVLRYSSVVPVNFRVFNAAPYC
ncbi:hypothetical protein CFC21_054492 [Triticum aestivum]|uniref:Uncharacterized protein n=3 Tax=Triticum TaxID=4564 RepID=A0A9R0STF5_TRITD|nr:hypothetical protein CFC21_054492 [Triticum aestivum]VAH98592.1 unnamed protein product [Triticum turgidum subsp. durum]